jgi:hypothetical protein
MALAQSWAVVVGLTAAVAFVALEAPAAFVCDF